MKAFSGYAVYRGSIESWAESPVVTTSVEHLGSSRKRVLVAYNGSKTAAAAIDVAADWSQAWSAETWVLYVRPWDMTRGAGRFFLETRSEARAVAQTGVDRLCSKGVAARAVVHDASRQRVPDTIVGKAEALGACCIVLGTHARGILSLAVLGSTSHAVLRKATRPVILVKAQ